MKSDTIRAQFGLTQREMAAMLGVHLSQWSMYECGQRNLPRHATLLLAELLTHLNAAQSTAKKHSDEDIELKEKQQYLEALLRENEYQRLLLEKKIIAFEKKQAAHLQAGLVIDYLSRHSDKPTAHLRFSKKKPERSEVKIAIDYEIKRELLTLEKLILESKLKKVNDQLNSTLHKFDEKQ